MEHSITVILPVHNVESTLAAEVAEILEAVSDLATSFEVIIIDDGSADATIEVIDELTRSYPQVHSLRHSKHRGRDEAIRTGLKYTTGETIFLRDATHAERRAGYHLLDRQAMEKIHRIGQPACLDNPPHLLAANVDELFGGTAPIGAYSI